MDARGATAVDVRRDVMDRFDDEIQRRLAPTVWNSGGSHSWYIGADGRNSGVAAASWTVALSWVPMVTAKMSKI